MSMQLTVMILRIRGSSGVSLLFLLPHLLLFHRNRPLITSNHLLFFLFTPRLCLLLLLLLPIPNLTTLIITPNPFQNIPLLFLTRNGRSSTWEIPNLCLLRSLNWLMPPTYFAIHIELRDPIILSSSFEAFQVCFVLVFQ